MTAFPGLFVRILGPGGATRNGLAVPLPRSRKVRALLAFLTLEPSPVSRSRLCDLLWDVPNDPRGELRWCLSKLRTVLDDADRRRVIGTGQEFVAFDLADCRVDALELERAVAAGLARATDAQLLELCELGRGDLLEGAPIDGTAQLSLWLTAQRQRFRSLRVAVLRELSARASKDSDEIFRHLQSWLQLSPFDECAHEAMLEALLERGRVRDADEHAAAAIRSFEREGLEGASLRQKWHVVRNHPSNAR